jgi:ABC-type branched-subunit amino acid transport system ATPase component
MHMLTITVSGPRGAGKSTVAHLLTKMFRTLGCRVELKENGEPVYSVDETAFAAVRANRPSVLITTRQE